MCARICAARSKRSAPHPPNSANPGRLILNGVLIEGALKVLTGNLGALELTHCTLVSRHQFVDRRRQSGTVDRSDARHLWRRDARNSREDLRLPDCIVDGDVSGRDVHVDASTIFGTTQAQTLQRQQQHPAGQGDGRTASGRVRAVSAICRSIPNHPAGTAANPKTHRGGSSPAEIRVDELRRAGTRSLRPSSAREIVSGRRRRGEMGAWHFVQAPLRLRNLRWPSTSICDSASKPARSSCRSSRSSAAARQQGITSERDIAVLAHERRRRRARHHRNVPRGQPRLRPRGRSSLRVNRGEQNDG